MPCDTHSAGIVAVKESSSLCSTWPGLPFQRLGRNSGPVRTSRVASPVFAVTTARTTGEGPLPVSCTFRRAGRPPTSLNASLTYSPTSSTCVCARYTAARVTGEEVGGGGDGLGGGDGGGGGGRPMMLSAVSVEPLRSAWSRVASVKSM
eukprot:scaffold51698_cov48-Phaeocystis_antarctica.AAC.1